MIVAVIIIAALLVTLLICALPFITLVAVLYGLVQLIKYYVPTKVKQKPVKKEKEENGAFQSSGVNNFIVDFLKQKNENNH